MPRHYRPRDPPPWTKGSQLLLIILHTNAGDTVLILVVPILNFTIFYILNQCVSHVRSCGIVVTNHDGAWSLINERENLGLMKLLVLRVKFILADPMGRDEQVCRCLIPNWLMIDACPVHRIFDEYHP